MTVEPVAFDLTRLITRLRHASPTGIDRVDLAYARHFLNDRAACFGIVSTRFGPRVLDRETSFRIVDAVAAGWAENGGSDDDPVFRTLTGQSEAVPAKRFGIRAVTRRRLQAEIRLRVLRAGGTRQLPRGTIYLHTSHLRLERPERFTWLDQRRDIRAVFLAHDLIPISHPEYGRPGEDRRHAIRMETVARHASHVIVTTADVGMRFSRYLASRGLGEKPLTIAPLGVEPVFSVCDGEPPRFARPTFVACGTIEPRKNHFLLLHLWRSLAERLGPNTPRLVVVGRRGWEAENVIDLLDRCAAIRPHVSEAGGLTSHGLARVMRGATALLMPSFVEGYGLPVVEAAAAGLPVVASDIPVHREIASSFAHFLDPLDGLGWAAAVEALSLPDSPLHHTLAGRLAGYRAPSWQDHFDTVETALAAPAPTSA